MGRTLRAEQFDAGEVGIVHAVQRCVRRAYLAGFDPVSGKSFEFRREWIRRRLELISAVFGLDVLTYAIMSNHLHVIVRTRPDVVLAWSDEEVATRWLKLFPGRRLEEYLGDPTKADIAMIVGNAKKLKEIRRRLSDVSWFMKSLAEPIARLANRQDGCTGRFWEGRFKAQKIVDEAGLLACAMYVDLNPVRAAMAETPEQSKFTSAFDRIQSVKGREIDSAAAEPAKSSIYEKALESTLAKAQENGDEKLVSKTQHEIAILKNKKEEQAKKKVRIARDGWLAPLELNERGPLGPQASRSRIRASDKGFLSLRLADYLKLLDWTGRQGRADKRGAIPGSLKPILERLGIEASMWCDLVWSYKKYFGRSPAAGKPESIKAEAQRRGRRWMSGQRGASECFNCS